MISAELWLICGLVFGAVLLGLQALYWLFFNEQRERNTINRRLVLTAQLGNSNEVMNALRRERSFEFLTDNASFQWLNTLLIQSGMKLTLPSLGAIIATLFVLFTALLIYTIGSIGVAVTFAIFLTIASLYLIFRRARSRRIAAFGEQLPDGLDIIVRGLRAGHPLRTALGLVAREMPDPIGSEFGLVADEIMFGLDQSTAIDNLHKRVGHGDLMFFATAVNIQNQTGGNLAEVLTRLSRLLRSRSKLRLKIRALSSEGRLSAVCLSLAPFVLFGIISLISPSYFRAVEDNPIIPLAAGLGLAMLTIGNIIMYRMVNFKF